MRKSRKSKVQKTDFLMGVSVVLGRGLDWEYQDMGNEGRMVGDIVGEWMVERLRAILRRTLRAWPSQPAKRSAWQKRDEA